MTCNSGHNNTFSTSRMVGTGKKGIPDVNLLLIVYTLLTGMCFDKLKVSSETSVTENKKKILNDIIYKLWRCDKKIAMIFGTRS